MVQDSSWDSYDRWWWPGGRASPAWADLNALYAGVWTDWWWRDAAGEVNWFTSSYPLLMPWYPLPSADPQWMDAWSMGLYHGYWG
jgi:hypothetical protein